MMMLDHPSIVKLNEVLENEEYVFFVMELCGGGSLSNYVEMKPLSERLARYYMPQLIKGLKYCHNKVGTPFTHTTHDTRATWPPPPVIGDHLIANIVCA
jgi:serine/threonine protein kinase